MSWFRKWVKKYFNLCDIKDLVIGGNCGCCGAGMPKEIFPKDWRWGLCKECIKGGEKESSNETFCSMYK